MVLLWRQRHCKKIYLYVVYVVAFLRFVPKNFGYWKEGKPHTYKHNLEFICLTPMPPELHLWGLIKLRFSDEGDKIEI